jgi:hypothetical protein
MLGSTLESPDRTVCTWFDYGLPESTHTTPATPRVRGGARNATPARRMPGTILVTISERPSATRQFGRSPRGSWPFLGLQARARVGCRAALWFSSVPETASNRRSLLLRPDRSQRSCTHSLRRGHNRAVPVRHDGSRRSRPPARVQKGQESINPYDLRVPHLGPPPGRSSLSKCPGALVQAPSDACQRAPAAVRGPRQNAPARIVSGRGCS